MRGLDKLLADEVEAFGRDFVLGLTDKPKRRPPAPERKPIFERPTGPEDFAPPGHTPPVHPG